MPFHLKKNQILLKKTLSAPQSSDHRSVIGQSLATAPAADLRRRHHSLRWPERGKISRFDPLDPLSLNPSSNLTKLQRKSP
ncbi:hypothetical protein V6Z11_D02G219000 [Gossypium hirsutum]